jgi:hypothetical protein
MTIPHFKVDIPGPPGCWEFVDNGGYFRRERDYKHGRFCWNHFRQRKIVFIRDRNKTGLCQPCACLLREARKRRKRQPVAKASGPSNAERGEETRRRILELLRGNGKMSTAEMAETLSMSRTAISLHLRHELAPFVKRSIGLNNCAVWELVA